MVPLVAGLRAAVRATGEEAAARADELTAGTPADELPLISSLTDRLDDTPAIAFTGDDGEEADVIDADEAGEPQTFLILGSDRRWADPPLRRPESCRTGARGPAPAPPGYLNQGKKAVRAAMLHGRPF